MTVYPTYPVHNALERLEALAHELESAELDERWTDALSARCFTEAAVLEAAADRLDALLAPLRQR